MFCAEKSDIFDILSYISYETEIKNRTERLKIAKSILEKYKNPKAKDFLQFLLELYERE
jgi:type I site-specific deoxyribonuclease